MKKKVLIFDLDGSVLSNEQISVKDIAALKKWEESGNDLSVATGRSFYRVEKILKEVPVTLPIILYNGAEILNLQNQNVESENCFNIETINSVFDSLYRMGELYNIILYLHSEIILFNPNTDLKIRTKEWKISKILQGSHLPIYGVKIYMISLFRVRREKIKLLGNLSVSYSGEYVDICMKNVSKGNAVRTILEGKEYEKVYVLGNDIKDLTMKFDNNVFIAVENADAEVRKEAGIISAACDNNPITSIIDRIL